MSKARSLKCDEVESVEEAELCEIRDKLTATGLGDLILNVYGEMLDRDRLVLDMLAVARVDPLAISELEGRMDELRHRVLEVLLDRAGITIPACTPAHMYDCIVVKARDRRLGLHYVTAEGDYVKLYP
jgi:hypothetical protein